MEASKTFVTVFESEADKYSVNYTNLELNSDEVIRVEKMQLNGYCSPCNLSFENNTEFEHHNIEMHNQRKTHKCDSCNTTFRRQDHLKRHIQNVHASSNRKYCRCPVCDKDCARRDMLLKHIRKKHSDKIEDFKCRDCNFKCNTLNELEQHERLHSSAERHICPDCCTTFKRRDHMLRHVKSQHLKQVVTCPICGQVYKRKDHVARHVREKHQMGFSNGRLVKSADILE